MSVLPPFDPSGVLPAQDYVLTFSQLRQTHLVTGEGNGPTWDVAWRQHLVDHCEHLVRQLQTVGIHNIFLDGSFVEQKDHPSDIDGYFECDPAELHLLVARLNQIEPIWSWDHRLRRYDPKTRKDQLPMWLAHHVEFYPHVGQPTGILDEHGQNQVFPAAFRKQRSTHQPKGIIKIL